MCARRGLVVPATICDHVPPHRGEIGAFWQGPSPLMEKYMRGGPGSPHLARRLAVIRLIAAISKLKLALPKFIENSRIPSPCVEARPPTFA